MQPCSLIVPISEFDHLRFDIEFAIKFDTFVPTTGRERSEWAEQASGKIAERLRRGWGFKRKAGVEKGPGFMSGLEMTKPK